MSRAPNITATIGAVDNLTPELQKIVANAMQIAERLNVFSNAFGKADMSAADLQRRFRQIAETTRLAFDANAATRFSGSIDKVGASMTVLQNKAALAHKEVGALARSLENIKQLASMTIGFEIAHAGEKVWKSAGGVAQAENAIRNVSGGDEKEVKTASRMADDISRRYPIVTKEQALEDYIEFRSLSVTDDPNAPIDMDRHRRNVETSAKLRKAAAARGGEITRYDARNLALFIDQSGMGGDIDAPEFVADLYERAKQYYGDAFSSDKLRDFSANAKAANFSMSRDSLLKVVARLASSNASRLGNEFAQTGNTFVGGKMTKQAAMWLASRGLINEDQIVSGDGGKFYIKGDIKGKDLLSVDQTAWAQEYVHQGMVDAGILAEEKVKKRMDFLRDAEKKANPNAKVDERELRRKAGAELVKEDVNAYLEMRNKDTDEESKRERAKHGLIADDLQRAGVRSTVTDNLAHSIATADQIKRDEIGLRRTLGMKGGENIDKNALASLKELQNATTTFAAALGTPAMADAAKALHNMAGYIAELTASFQAWQEQNPELAKALAVGAPAAAVVGGAGLAWGAFNGLMSGFGLSSSAVALDGSAAALTAAAVKLGASGGIPGAIANTATSAAAGAGLSGALPATGAAIGAVGTGAAPAAVVGGVTLAGLAGSAWYALGELNKYAEKTGKSEWSLARLWSNIVTGQDRPVPDAKTDPEGHAKHLAENKAELDRRIAERDKWKAEHGDKAMPTDFNRPPVKTWREWLFGDGTGPKIGTGMYRLDGPGNFDTRQDIHRRQKDDDLAPDAPLRHWTGKTVGISEALKPGAQEVKITTDVKGETEVTNTVKVEVSLDGTTRQLIRQKASVPLLNTGAQGAGTGSTLRGDAHYRRDNT